METDSEGIKDSSASIKQETDHLNKPNREDKKVYLTSNGEVILEAISTDTGNPVDNGTSIEDLL